LRTLAARLAEFIHSAYDPKASWEAAALPSVGRLEDGISEEAFNAFLRQFLAAMLDLYWHSARECPADPTLPKDVESALSFAAVLRTMPKKLREEYLEHARSVNSLPGRLD
jgi:hypothetical protein